MYNNGNQIYENGIECTNGDCTKNGQKVPSNRNFRSYNAGPQDIGILVRGNKLICDDVTCRPKTTEEIANTVTQKPLPDTWTPPTWTALPENWTPLPLDWSPLPGDWSPLPADWKALPDNWTALPPNWTVFPENWTVLPKDWSPFGERTTTTSTTTEAAVDEIDAQPDVTVISTESAVTSSSTTTQSDKFEKIG